MRVFKGVSPRFFAATGTRFVAGRDYEWADLYGRRPVVIVSENLARELWGTPQQAHRQAPAGVAAGIAVARGHRRRAGRARQRRAAAGAGHRLLAGARRQRCIAPARPQVERAVTFAIRTPRAGSEGLLNEIKQAIWARERQPAAGLGAHDAGGLRQVDGADVVHAGDAVDRRRRGARARPGRHLRGDRLHGVAADAGDRDSPGPGRAARRREADVRALGTGAGRRRHRRRAGRGRGC